MRQTLARFVLFCCAALLALACDGGGLPPSLGRTPSGDGPRVRWDLNARPLPEIPLPNDVATWPDPTSPTGRRINASFVAPTALESRVRAEFGDMDGWGTYAPITVAFDAPLDLQNLIDRQGGSRFAESDFARHAVYIVDLTTGAPVPIDIDGGAFHYVTEHTGRYYPNDPRALEAQILMESVEEDLDHDGVLDPGEDTDYDGVLDHPNTLDGTRYATPEETYDHMVWFWERETNTLILRPLLPLEEQHEYAVVLTDRLVGETGEPVRSPFDAVHHVSQIDSVRRLPELFQQHPGIYGDLASRGLDGVAFAWTFTTQTVTSDLVELREGLYGRGRFAWLADQFPPDLYVVPSRGGSTRVHCDPGSPNLTSIPFDALREPLRQLATQALGVDSDGVEALLETYDNVDHVVIGYYESPFLAGDPRNPGSDDHWTLDALSPEAPPHRDLVPVIIVVPKEDATHHQPFPVAFYGHGYTGANIEALGFAGEIARNGVATVAIDAVGHGLGLTAAIRNLAEALFTTSCLGPMGRMFSVDRCVDLDHDAMHTPDPGGDFWSAYIFHTRDVVRQSVLDHIQLLRILRSFGADGPGGQRTTPAYTFTPPTGDPIESTGDLDGDGHVDAAGDWDLDGTPDVGGWNNDYHAWGESLGAFIAPILGGVDPAIRTAAPTSGAGGLIDVSIRSDLGGVRDAVILRAMGPFVVGLPNTGGPTADSACEMGQTSAAIIATDVNSARTIEFACLDTTELAEGDAVVVTNLSDRESRCGGVGPGGAFRVPIPADAGDVLEVDVYHGAAMAMDYATCRMRDGSRPAPSRVISSWESQHGGGAGHCAHCAAYQDTVFDADEFPFLIAPTEGFGLRRQSPEYRRFQALAQTALEPADPINYVGRFFLDPISAPDVAGSDDPARQRSLLIAMSVGDQDVPLSAGNAMARAAGVLAFLPPDAPDVLADWRTPAAFATTHPGFVTPHELLNGFHVMEGVSRLGRHPVADGMNFLADVDDLGEGLQLFTMDGNAGGTIQPVRASPPLRWTRESVRAGATRSPFDPTVGSYMAISGMLEVYVLPFGNHGTEVPDVNKTWDEGLYFPHLVGRFFDTNGADLRYHTDPAGHQCLEDWTCDFSTP